MKELSVNLIAEGITTDPKKQVWIKRVIRELGNATWLLPDQTLKVVKPHRLRGMIRRRRNQAEYILEMLKEASKG